MAKYILKRLLWMIPVIIGVSLLVFVVLDFSPGEPARMVLGDQATDEDVAEFNEKYGLNDPVLAQYGKYMWNVLTKGDFGESYVTGRSETASDNRSLWGRRLLAAPLSRCRMPPPSSSQYP